VKKMKVIKMKVHRFDPGHGGTRDEYPPGYDPKKVVMGPHYEKGAKERGENFQFIIFGVRDADAAQFLNADAVEVNAKSGQKFKFEAAEQTRAEAEAEIDGFLRGEEYNQGAEFIEDDMVIAKTLAKVGKGEQLSQKEQDSLDPDKPERGLGRKKSVKEHWDVKFAKF
jgi:hypothetical protein